MLAGCGDRGTDDADGAAGTSGIVERTRTTLGDPRRRRSRQPHELLILRDVS